MQTFWRGFEKRAFLNVPLMSSKNKKHHLTLGLAGPGYSYTPAGERKDKNWAGAVGISAFGPHIGLMYHGTKNRTEAAEKATKPGEEAQKKEEK